MRNRFVLALCVAAALVGATLSGSNAVAAGSPAGRLVSEVAASGTPHVLDGRDLSVAQVGTTMILGGTFTQARNDDSATVLTRNRLLAFDATTGQISTTFNPAPNGSGIEIVLPAGDGSTVYVAGSFTTIGGVARTNVARIRVADGTVVSTFNAGTVSGTIRDLALKDGRLWLAGAFTHVGGHRQPALATVDPTTGAFLPFMGMAVEGNHNGGVTQVLKIGINPSGTRLVAIGNFDTLDLVRHHQIFMLDLTGAAAGAADFNTAFYTSACSGSFDSYMRDIDFSPDGAFFVVSTTGAYGGSTSACDETSRWETGSTGSTVVPSWTDYTGGDTTYGVEVTGDAVYVGGHFRWQNNPLAGDRAGQGAVSREGLAALDPLNGLPMTWDPTRTKGVGVFDFLFTSQGLWIASDTDRIGNFQYKGRIARMPRTGVSFPAVNTPGLPNDVYSVGTTGTLSRRAYADGAVGASQGVPTGGIDWNSVRGAFMLNGWLYLARSDGSFTKRTFDGSTYGPALPVNTSDLIVPLTDWRADIQAATGMFYDSGRIYFTRSGSSQLFYRYFTPQSDVVGAKRLVASNNVSGIDFSQVRGMFGTNDLLYWATSNGVLHRINWQQAGPSGAPVAGTATITSGPGVDANLWNARALFLYQDANGVGAGPAPTATFTQACAGLACTFDASGSSAPGGSITGYAWDFGDGSTGTGVSPSHTFPASGTFTVTLTVTSNSNGTASTSRTFAVAAVNEPPVAAFVASCAGLTCSFDGNGSSDPDGTVASYAWDFGDGATGSGATSSHTYAAAGSRTVTLTVTDNDGATDPVSHDVSPSVAVVSFQGASNSNRNAVTHTVTIPANVVAGDTLVLAMTVNTATVTVQSLPGWTLLESASGSNVAGRLWTRDAVAGDAGTSVSVTLSDIAKADLSLAAYHGSTGTSVTGHAVAVDQVSGTAHTSPTVNVPGSGSWVSTYWAAKTSDDVGWSTPAGQAVRTTAPGSGGGRIASVLVDSDGAVPPGSAGGLVGTTSIAVNRVIMFTTVVSLE